MGGEEVAQHTARLPGRACDPGQGWGGESTRERTDSVRERDTRRDKERETERAGKRRAGGRRERQEREGERRGSGTQFPFLNRAVQGKEEQMAYSAGFGKAMRTWATLPLSVSSVSKTRREAGGIQDQILSRDRSGKGTAGLGCAQQLVVCGESQSSPCASVQESAKWSELTPWLPPPPRRKRARACMCVCRSQHLGSDTLDSTTSGLWASPRWGWEQLGQRPLPGRGSAWAPVSASPCSSQRLPPPPRLLPHPARQAPATERRSVWGQPFVDGKSLFSSLPVLGFILLWPLIPTVEHLLCAGSGAKVFNRSSHRGLFTDAPFLHVRTVRPARI